MKNKLKNDSQLRAATCSPSPLTPETDAGEFPVMTWPSRENPLVVRSTLARKLETERDELAGYLCRIKLPLPISFLTRLTDLFPGKNFRMKNLDGYLCIFSENDPA